MPISGVDGALATIRAAGDACVAPTVSGARERAFDERETILLAVS